LQYELLKRAFEGDELAISRVLTHVEHLTELGAEFLKELIPRAGKAHTIGITGSPGAGKSTLIGSLIDELTRRGHKVGVILIDPSSPISSGSFMGNRIRMSGKELGKDVFIRSLATRGHLGGISADALLLIEAMDALGFDKILIETVGAGQTDTEIMNAVHTTVVVMVPGTGDEIQALKAGIMEIGDVYVVNKSDKPESEMLFEAVKFALEGVKNPKYDWEPKIVRTVATRGQGVSELVDVLNEHLKFLIDDGIFTKVVLQRRKKLVELIVRKRVNMIVSKVVERADNLFEKFNKNEINIIDVIDNIYKEVKMSL